MMGRERHRSQLQAAPASQTGIISTQKYVRMVMDHNPLSETGILESTLRFFKMKKSLMRNGDI